MWLKHRNDVKWDDLAYIESAYFAQYHVEQALGNRHRHIVGLERLLWEDAQFLRPLSGREHDEKKQRAWARLQERIKGHEVVLVIDRLSSPLAPLFRWKAEAGQPHGGRWEIQASPHTLGRSGVERLLSEVQAPAAKSTGGGDGLKAVVAERVKATDAVQNLPPAATAAAAPLAAATVASTTESIHIIEVKPVSGRNQYINLDPVDDDAARGRSVAVSARLNEPKAGVTIYFGIEAGANNRAELPADLQATISKSATTDARGVAKTQLTLSRFGGDRFKVLASLQPTLDAAEKSGEIEVWRRMMYQITADDGATLPARAITFDAFKKTFLEIREVDENKIKYRDLKGLSYHPLWQFRPYLASSGDGEREIVCVGNHNKETFYKQFKVSDKKPRAHLIMCDEQWDPVDGQLIRKALTQRDTELEQWNFKEDKRLGVFKPTLDGAPLVNEGTWTWSDDVTIHNGTFTDADIFVDKTRDHTSKFRVRVPALCKAGECKGCSGGTAINPSVAHPVGVKMDLHGATGPWAGESGQPGRPHCLIVVDNNPNQFNNTVAHEIGHLFKQVREEKDWLGIQDHDDHYVGHGGQGSHCKKDATLVTKNTSTGTTEEYEDGTCIMFHIAVGNRLFCDQCGLDLRIRDMSDFFK